MTVQFKKIMITLDGSALAAQALPHAEMLAQSLGAKLVLFESVPEVEMKMDILTGAVDMKGNDNRQRHYVDEAERPLEDLAESLKHRNVKAEVVVEVGHPDHTIIDYAVDNGVDLIVMSTHGRTGLARLVYGSVAEKVLHTAPCPVLLVRSKIE